MKALFDFFPILAFFVAYMVFGQDIYLATKVMMAATALQVAYLLIRRLPITMTHILSAVIAWGFGGLSLAMHDPLFIKLKPTVVNWLFAAMFLGSQYIGKKPLLQRTLEQAVQVDAATWRKMNMAWVALFFFLGVLNLYVVYNYSEAFWVKFKFFGLIGLTFLFSIGQAIWIASKTSADPADPSGDSNA